MPQDARASYLFRIRLFKNLLSKEKSVTVGGLCYRYLSTFLGFDYAKQCTPVFVCALLGLIQLETAWPKVCLYLARSKILLFLAVNVVNCLLISSHEQLVFTVFQIFKAYN